MPAKSKKQQRYFGMVKAGKISKPEGMSDEDVNKMARTKHKGLPEDYSIKQLIEGMTFSTFLIVEQMPGMDESTVQGYIRSLPSYQEMIKDPQTKPAVLKLARNMMDEFGDGPMDQNSQNYILDQFDDLSRETYKSGAMVGDWKGEEEYRRQQEEQGDIDSAVDKWEQGTGMDAETGEDIAPKRQRMKRGATHQAGKYAKAKQDMASFADAPAPEQADRLATAKTQAVGDKPARGAKMAGARAIFDEEFGESRPSAIIRRMMDEVGMSKPHATTYYYNFKKKRAAAEQQ